MLSSSTTVKTQHGSRYLTRLCKHWRHKLAVDCSDNEGRIDFGEGRLCTLAASPDSLAIEVQAPDQNSLTRLEQVVADHLIRMAHKDALSAPLWTRG